MSKSLIGQWNELASQTMQTSVAAPQVIAHRVSRMMTAGPFPNKRDRREFTVMGTEKVTAFTNGAWAMYWRGCQLQQQWLMQMTQAWWKTALSADFSQAQNNHRWWLDQWMRSSNNALDIANSGVRPVRKRAVANSHRLARASRARR